MNQSDKIKIQEKISQEIEKTTNNILKYKKMCKPIAPDDSIGRVSRMDAINNKSVLEAALRKAENKLKKLKIVKTEIHNINFGFCIKCKNPIPVPRLILIPESKNCVNCA